MKRIIIIGLLCAMSLASCSPLRIVVNTQTPDGVRTVCTSPIDLFRYSDGTIGLAMGGRLAKKDTVIALGIRCDAKTKHGIFDKGDRLMFRLNDDSEVILTNVWDKEYVEDKETHVTQEYRHTYGFSYCYHPFYDPYFVTPYEIGTMVPTVYIEDNSASYALYLITYDQYQAIVTKGVKKFRVECESKDLDMPDPSNLPKILTDLFECLVSGVRNTVVRTEF